MLSGCCNRQPIIQTPWQIPSELLIRCVATKIDSPTITALLEADIKNMEAIAACNGQLDAISNLNEKMRKIK